MTQKTINLIALFGSIALVLLIGPALCHSTSIHWEDITPIGSDKLVVIDKAGVTHADLDVVCRALPLKSYGYAVTVYGSVICMEARQESDWELIKEYIEDQFGD